MGFNRVKFSFELLETQALHSGLSNRLRKEHALPQLGHINYVNSLPIILPITTGRVRLEAKIHLGTPTELNQGYASGKLDIGAMSASFYLERNDLTIFPNISISGQKAVGSVLFFSKSDLAHSHRLKIAVPRASATSVNLLTILFLEEAIPMPLFVVKDNPDLTSEDIDGALVIGDRALSVDEEWSKIAERIDLGSWWYKTFRLPAVFGLWAARSSWARANTYRFLEISNALTLARQTGITTAFAEVLEEAKARLGLSTERLEKYYCEELDFSFNVAHQMALSKYGDLCQRYGLLNNALPLEQSPSQPATI